MIERLILPERQPRAPENLIRHPSSPSLEPAHDGRQRDLGFQDHMNMVRHNHPSMKLIRPTCRSTITKSRFNHFCDPRIAEPKWTTPVQPLILREKPQSSSILRCENFRLTRSRRPGKTPGNKEDRRIWYPVRKMPSIVHEQKQTTKTDGLLYCVEKKRRFSLIVKLGSR